MPQTQFHQEQSVYEERFRKALHPTTCLAAMPSPVESFRAFVRQLAARPGMWVGPNPSVSKFATAIAGYQSGLHDAGFLDVESISSWRFGEWLAAKWGVSAVVGWDAHIAERFGDDQAGIAEAAKLIEQWLHACEEG